MKTKQVSIYRFAELSDNAKDNVRSWISETNESAYFTVEALKGIAKYMGFELRDYGIDAASAAGSHVKITHSYPEITGVRLWKWLNNNYPSLVKDAENNKMSGWWLDYYFAKPFVDFLKKPGKYTDMADLVSWGIDNVLRIMEKDYWSQLEDDAILEMCEANNYWFDEKGNLTSEY